MKRTKLGTNGAVSPRTFAEFFERAPLGFAVWRLDDPDDHTSFRLLTRNDAAARLTGLTAEQLRGSTMGELRDVVSPGLSQLYWKVLRSGGAQDLGEFESEDGLLAFAVKAFALPDDCVGVAFEDIAERKRADLSLRASEAMNAALLDAIPDLTVRFRKDGQILDARDGKEPLGPLPASRLIGRSAITLAPPGMAETTIRYVRSALRSGRVQTYEYAARVDGSTRYREVRLAPSGPDEVVAIVRDITERTRAEKELRQSEERFRLLAENARDVIYRYRLTEPRGYEYVSPSVTAIHGYTPEQYYADPDFPLRIIHPDDLSHFHEMVRTRHTGSIELRCIKTDGSIVWTEQRNTPIYDDTGALIAIEGIVRDVTERKRAEEALRASEKRFRLLAENAQDIIFRLRLVEPIGFDYVSPAMATLTGYRPEECYRNPNFAASIVHPDDRAAYRRMVWERQTGRIELRWVCKDGSVIWIEQRSTPVYDSSGRPVAIEGVVRNITDRVRAEETLRESEERFRLLAENARDMIFRFRIAEPRGFDYVSPALTAMAGYTPEQYYADPDFPSKIIHPDDRDALERMVRERQEGPVELRWICKDGSTIWTEQRNTLIYDGAGTLVAAEGIARDVTNRKSAEQALRASEERYRLLAERAQDVIYRYHIAPYRSFDYVSPSMTALLGYTPEECYADPDLIRRLVHKEDAPLVRELILGGQSPVITVRGLRKDGTVVWIEQRNVPIHDEEGTLIAIEGIARDISERVHAEEERQLAREELETKVEAQLERSKSRYGLTFRELTVLNLVAAGKADKEIASELGISPLTVHKHLTNILGKMNAASRTEAGVRALREGLVT